MERVKMNKEEIENRIIVCEERAKGYREVGKNFIADKYENEKYKWEKLLSDLELLNERKIEELLDYKRGFLKLKDKLNKIEHFIDSHATDFDDGRWNLELTEIELLELQKIIKEV